jgi:DNA repair protein RadD
MRLFQGKDNCLLLDFGRNLDRHGPIDKIRGKAKSETSGEGEAPLKQCPSCFEPVYAAVRHCPACGFEFPPNDLNIDIKPSDSAVFSTQIVPIDYNVLNVQYKRHAGKDGKPDSMMVVYTTMSGQIREWVFFDHPAGSIPKKKAEKWAKDRGLWAENLEHALATNWPKPLIVSAIKEGKYYTIKKVIFS